MGDRVTEAYQGDLGDTVQRLTRERVHWICSAVEGQRVLDLGCSQGIVGILLAREGFEVTGVDIDPNAVEYAREALAGEPESIRERVTFEVTGADGLEDGAFDAVVLGDVIENLAIPSRLLSEVWRVLREGGQLVLTAPFGLGRGAVNQQTFYVDDLLLAVGPWFRGESLAVEEGHLRYLGRRRETVDDSPGLEAFRTEVGGDRLVAVQREALEARERAHIEALSHAEARQSEQAEALTSARDEIERLRDEIAEASRRRAEIERAHQASQRELSELRASLEQERQARAEIEATAEQLGSQNRDLEHQLQLRAKDLEHQAELRTKDLERQAEREAEARELVVQLERRHDKAQRRADLADQARRVLEGRLSTLQDAVTKEGRRADKHKARWRRAQAQADNLRAQLERAHRNYKDLVETNRYRFSEAIWQALRSPRAAATLPVTMGKIAANSVAKRWLAKAPTPSAETAFGSAAKSEPAGSQRQAGSTGRAPRASQRVAAQPLVAGRRQTPTHPRELWVAAILDEMSTACFRPECNLITFRPDNWREVLEERPPHFLFVESAWHGNGGSWQYKIGRYDHPSATGLSELLAWCQRRDIPTVFWNKEDPVHFDKFKDAARQFDFVFTTDADVIPRYEALGIDQVDALLFAAQPRLHNPIWAGPRAREPVFAGSYYGNRHHERRVQQEDLLDAARRFDLVIYDRNWGSQDPAYQFPDRFTPHIKGRLPYEELSRVHRLHRVFLNVNSVIDSPTMLSRRVFELLACGTAVVSTPSRALDEIFGELVPTVASTEEAERVLEALLDDDEHWRDLTERGIRFVLSKHTYRHRLAQIAATLGFAEAADPHEEVAAFATVRDLGEARTVIDTVAKQTAPVRELILGAGKGVEDVEVEALASRVPGLSLQLLTQLDPASHGAATRDLAQLTDADWLWAVDPSRPADPDQLRDLTSCLTFAEADVIGESLPQASDGAGLHRFTSQINPRGALVRRSVVAERGWDLDATAEQLRTWAAQGLRLYCARRAAAVAAQAAERTGERG